MRNFRTWRGLYHTFRRESTGTGTLLHVPIYRDDGPTWKIVKSRSRRHFVRPVQHRPTPPHALPRPPGWPRRPSHAAARLAAARLARHGSARLRHTPALLGYAGLARSLRSRLASALPRRAGLGRAPRCGGSGTAFGTCPRTPPRSAPPATGIRRSPPRSPASAGELGTLALASARARSRQRPCQACQIVGRHRTTANRQGWPVHLA